MLSPQVYEHVITVCGQCTHVGDRDRDQAFTFKAAEDHMGNIPDGALRARLRGGETCLLWPHDAIWQCFGGRRGMSGRCCRVFGSFRMVFIPAPRGRL